MLQLLLTLMSVCLPFNYPASPVVEVALVGESLVALHADKSVSMVGLVDGELGCSVATEGASSSAPQGPAAPLPTLSCSWRSDDGSTHTVTTPMPSTTPAGLEAAIQLHRTLVDRMKQVYPPKQPPP